MQRTDRAIVTGAFSYTGRYIARLLLDQRVSVTALTRHPDLCNEFEGVVSMADLDFNDSEGIRRSMEGARVFYNTYWIRFERGGATFENAVENSKLLFSAAADAGVEKIVHISVSNPSPKSVLPYFSGKWQVEKELERVGVAHTIIRPTLVFGAGDILLNNIAWAIRRFPIFPVYGDGNYPVQPVFAGDVAALAVAAADGDDSIIDAAGPETFLFSEMLRLIVTTTRARTCLVRTPPDVGFALTSIVGILKRDKVLTRDEIDGLMAGLLTSESPPTCATSFTAWLGSNAPSLGRRYESELRRNWTRRP